MRQQVSEEGKLRRHHQVTELLRREIQEIVSRETKDPRVSSFTITEVALKSDLKSAIVYVCKFKGGVSVGGNPLEPTAAEQTELIKGLQSASHFIYSQLKKRLNMKVIPSIKFEYDFRLGEASKVWNLISKEGRDLETITHGTYSQGMLRDTPDESKLAEKLAAKLERRAESESNSKEKF
jgi:ribosome-binding factor A